MPNKPTMHLYMRSKCPLKIVSKKEALVHLIMKDHKSLNLRDREWCSLSRRPAGYSQTSCLSSPWLYSACRQHRQSTARKSLSYQAAEPTQRKSESTVDAVGKRMMILNKMKTNLHEYQIPLNTMLRWSLYKRL